MSINFDKNKYLKHLELDEGEKSFFDIKSLTDDNKINLNKIPFSIRVLIENVLRSNQVVPLTEEVSCFKIKS